VFRQKLEFPALEQAVRDLAGLHRASIVLVEDSASGTQLIQQLRAENFSLVQAASAKDGDKVMRLRTQTAKIEGGFALFPEKAPWLDAYLLELTSFPYAKNDDQVDSTVHALAWLTDSQSSSFENAMETLRLLGEYYEGSADKEKLVKVRTLDGGTIRTITGQSINSSPGEIITIDQETAAALCRGTRFQRVVD